MTPTAARKTHRVWLGTDFVSREYAPFVAELRHLRYFIAVAEELNFSRAAKRLRMAQPPLSVAIRQLEREIGTPLFQRSSREVRLTEAGTAFLPGARRALAEADAAVTSARRAGAGEIGTLRVGYNWSASFETLPALGQAFTRHHPFLTDVGAQYELIRREPVVAVLSSTHPLAGEAAIALSALTEEFLLFPRELAPRLHDFYANLCRTAGFEPKQGVESSRSRWTIGTWEASTTGLFPRSVATDLPDGLAAVPINDPTGMLESELVWRSDNESPTLAAFIEVSSSVFSNSRVTR